MVFPVTGAATSSLDLNSVLENKAYNITGIRKVINLTTDPQQLTDILNDYTPGAVRGNGFTNDPGIVTFTSAVQADEFVKIVFEFVLLLFSFESVILRTLLVFFLVSIFVIFCIIVLILIF